MVFFDRDTMTIILILVKYTGNILGHLSARCHEFVTNNHCITACSPNVYVWFDKTGNTGNINHVTGMKVCKDFCNDFYSACKDDYICFNEEGMKEYVYDLFTNALR